MNDTERTTFPLSSIHTCWQGERIVAMEQPLRRGLSLLRAQLDNTEAAIIAIRTEFDFDGMYETIEEIDTIPSGIDAMCRVRAMLETFRRAISVRYPDLKPDRDDVLPLGVMPATRSVLPGAFPSQAAGFRFANTALYQSVYLRLHLVERGDEPDSLFDRVLCYDGIQETLIDHVARLGGYA